MGHPRAQNGGSSKRLLISRSVTAGRPAQIAAPADLTEFSREDLMNVPVTSVSKKEQSWRGPGETVWGTSAVNGSIK
ncbi:MAG: hypothetical protein M3N41_11555 [Acidobacteriota bacterium]|nr:hypothetical protein [Acidobacteriota bacterium]